MTRNRATKNFSWSELTCKCGCGTRNISPRALVKLQALRDLVGRPLIINCAARCPIHNARVGGVPRSQHRSSEYMQSTAFDISLRNIDKDLLVSCAEKVGFGGIGKHYRTFVHVDDRGYAARW